MTAWLFPGQGSQRPGMAAGLESCTRLFELARSILNVDLEPLCTSESTGSWPPALLQPAIYTTSVGAALSLKAQGLNPREVLGHSLGEYAALVTAGSLDFEQGLRVVDVRGKAMAATARKRGGGMAAVIGLDVTTIEEICGEVGGVWVANLNSPNQIVISGRDKSLGRAAKLCLEVGAARVIRLEVPVAAHTPLMEPAAEEVAAALHDVDLQTPASGFYSVVDAARHEDPDEIKGVLVKGITSRVRFADALVEMRKDGVESFLELGPGRTLRGLVRQTLPGVSLLASADDSEAENLVREAAEGAEAKAGAS